MNTGLRKCIVILFVLIVSLPVFPRNYSAFRDSISMKWGIRMTTGDSSKITVQPKYDYIGDFIGVKGDPDKYIATFAFDKKKGVIDQNGNYVIPPQYENMSGFTKNSMLAAFIRNGKYGIVDLKGNEIVLPDYDNFSLFDGVNNIALCRNGKWALANAKGEILTGFIYDGIAYNSDRKAIAVSLDDKVGLIDTAGIEVLPPMYDDFSNCRFGYYVVTKGDKKGLVNSANETVLPVNYTDNNLLKKDIYAILQPFEVVPLDKVLTGLFVKIMDDYAYIKPNDNGTMILLTSFADWCKPCDDYYKDVLVPFAWDNPYMNYIVVDITGKHNDSSEKKEAYDYLTNKYGSSVPVIIYMPFTGYDYSLSGKHTDMELIQFLKDSYMKALNERENEILMLGF